MDGTSCSIGAAFNVTFTKVYVDEFQLKMPGGEQRAAAMKQRF
jgi:hypothetical protein